jgi:hypothetical protein
MPALFGAESIHQHLSKSRIARSRSVRDTSASSSA